MLSQRAQRSLAHLIRREFTPSFSSWRAYFQGRRLTDPDGDNEDNATSFEAVMVDSTHSMVSTETTAHRKKAKKNRDKKHNNNKGAAVAGGLPDPYKSHPDARAGHMTESPEPGDAQLPALPPSQLPGQRNAIAFLLGWRVVGSRREYLVRYQANWYDDKYIRRKQDDEDDEEERGFRYYLRVDQQAPIDIPVRRVKPYADSNHPGKLRVRFLDKYVSSDVLCQHEDLIKQFQDVTDRPEFKMSKKQVKRFCKDLRKSRRMTATVRGARDFYPAVKKYFSVNPDTDQPWKSGSPIQKLLDMPKRRPVLLQINAFDDESERYYRMTFARGSFHAFLVHGVGELQTNPCAYCREGRGAFIGCVTLAGRFGGACACCRYKRRNTKCSLHKSNEITVRHNRPRVALRHRHERRAHRPPIVEDDLSEDESADQNDAITIRASKPDLLKHLHVVPTVENNDSDDDDADTNEEASKRGESDTQMDTDPIWKPIPPTAGVQTARQRLLEAQKKRGQESRPPTPGPSRPKNSMLAGVPQDIESVSSEARDTVSGCATPQQHQTQTMVMYSTPQWRPVNGGVDAAGTQKAIRDKGKIAVYKIAKISKHYKSRNATRNADQILAASIGQAASADGTARMESNIPIDVPQSHVERHSVSADSSKTAEQTIRPGIPILPVRDSETDAKDLLLRRLHDLIASGKQSAARPDTPTAIRPQFSMPPPMLKPSHSGRCRDKSARSSKHHEISSRRAPIPLPPLSAGQRHNDYTHTSHSYTGNSASGFSGSRKTSLDKASRRRKKQHQRRRSNTSSFTAGVNTSPHSPTIPAATQRSIRPGTDWFTLQNARQDGLKQKRDVSDGYIRATAETTGSTHSTSARPRTPKRSREETARHSTKSLPRQIIDLTSP